MPLTELQMKYGPFAIPVPPRFGLDHVVTCGVEDRLREVKRSTDIEWLREVIRDRDMQTTVRLAAERRHRKLMKEVSP